MKVDERATFTSIINKFTGKKKRQYYNAMLNIVNGKLDMRKAAMVKMFIKPDRWPEDVIRTKAPRAIQYRSKEYNLMLATWLDPVEQKLYDHIKHRGTRVVAKGLNNRERAELWMQKVEDYSSPVFINLDHSKFDSTVNVKHLMNLHRIYKRIVGKGIYGLLKYQLKNICYTDTGVKYKTQGTRCSGDYDTGLGNTLINIACILQCFRKIQKYDFMLDGDDAIIVIESIDRDNLDIGDFEKFGFETVLSFHRDRHAVEFCQSRILDIGGPYFVRNPIRAISNTMVINKNYGFKFMSRYLAGVGLGELAMNKGVPILQQQGARLAETSNLPYYDADVSWQMANLGTKPCIATVTPQARMSMEKTWGITVQMQKYIEASLLPMTISYIARADVRILNYDLESLYRAWQGVATMGCACFAGRWEFGGGST